ncbi:hypothetical protein, partial [Arenimonas composti]
ARLERAAAFLAAHQDEPLTSPLLIAGLLALAWCVLLAWMAASGWPRGGDEVRIAAGIARIERGEDGGMSALRIGDDGPRFECGRRGRFGWRVLHAPVLECGRHAERLFAVAQGNDVHARYDLAGGDGPAFPRLLALTVRGEPLWTLADSSEQYAWRVIRAGLVGAALFLIPGWLLHLLWRRFSG